MHHTSTIPCKLFSQMSRVHWEKFHHKFENNFLRILKHNISISFISTVTCLQKHTHTHTLPSSLPSSPHHSFPWTFHWNFNFSHLWNAAISGLCLYVDSNWESPRAPLPTLSLSLSEFLFVKMCHVWGLLCPLLRSVAFRKIYHLLLGILHSWLREGPHCRGRWFSAGSKILKGN